MKIVGKKLLETVGNDKKKLAFKTRPFNNNF